MAVLPIIDAAEFEAVQTLLETCSPAHSPLRVSPAAQHCSRASASALAAARRCCGLGREGATGTTRARPRLGRAKLAARAERCPWTSSTASWLITSRIGRYSPCASRKSFTPCSTVARSAPGAPNGAYRRIAQAGVRSGRQTQAVLRCDRERHRRSLGPDAEELKAIRDQARADAERAQDAMERVGPSITPQAIKMFARQVCKHMRTESGGYRRDHLRARAQRVEVDAQEVRIIRTRINGVGKKWGRCFSRCFSGNCSPPELS